MASRRMFAKVITNSDDFLALPAMSQLLYFHLSMNADDDGFINNYRSVMRNIQASEDDLQALFDNYFAYRFENKVIVMLDWLVNNLIRKNRYTATQFVKELSQLEITENKRYKVNGSTKDSHCTTIVQPKDVQCTAVGFPSTVQYSTGKDSIGKVRRESPQADGAPTIEQIRTFCNEQGITIDIDIFYNHYASIGWIVSGKPVKSWQALVRRWFAQDKKRSEQASKPPDESWLDKLDNLDD